MGEEEQPKYTPGPWWNESGVIHAPHPELWSEDNHAAEHVCRVTSDRAEADAALIAAAPDLLEACEDLLIVIDEIADGGTVDQNAMLYLVQMAENAIAKAKGGDTDSDNVK